VVAGDVASWSSLLQSVESERAAIVDGLLTVARSEEVDAERRTEAIFLLGRLPTEKGLTYCLDHLGLVVPRDIIGDDDVSKLSPCQYALERAGWTAVPFLRPWVDRQERSEQDLALVGRLLVTICGKAPALGVVASWRDAAEGTGGFESRRGRWTSVRAAIERDPRR
jgi:hypothetical protein